MQPYSDGFKARMVQRMTGADSISAMALSREVGVPQPTLSDWLRKARTFAAMNDTKRDGGAPNRRPKDWTPEEKIAAVHEAAGLNDAELGVFLRKKGLHETQLREWRAAVAAALSGEQKQPSAKRSSAEARQIALLQKELLRKDRALAEVTALLALKKKLDQLLGVEDDDTPPRRGM